MNNESQRDVFINQIMDLDDDIQSNLQKMIQEAMNLVDKLTEAEESFREMQPQIDSKTIGSDKLLVEANQRIEDLTQ